MVVAYVEQSYKHLFGGIICGSLALENQVRLQLWCGVCSVLTLMWHSLGDDWCFSPLWNGRYPKNFNINTVLSF